MTVIVSNNAKSTLIEDIDTDDTQIFIPLGDYETFLRNSGDHMYAVLLDVDDKELIKVDLAASGVHQRKIAGGVESYSGGLVVTRAQGGSTAAAWKAGAIIYNNVTEGLLNEIRQQSVCRNIDYNPNAILSPAYANERVYQSDLALHWQAVGETTTWELIAGVMTVATPVLSPEAGSYANGQACTITCTTSGASIYYTLDGSTPDANSTLYSGAVSLPDDSTTTVKAIAIHSAKWWTDSAVGSAEYVTAAVPSLKIWFARGTADSIMMQFDTGTGELTKVGADYTYILDAQMATYLNGDMWVAAMRDADACDRVDPNGLTGRVYDVLESIALPASSGPACITHDGTNLWLGGIQDAGGDMVWRVNPTTKAVTAVTGLSGENPKSIVFDGTHIWVATDDPEDLYNNNGWVEKIDINTCAVVAKVTCQVHADYLHFDGTSLWVANVKSDTLSKVNIATNAVDATVVVGQSPMAMADDGSYLWVANYADHSLTKINLATDTVADTIALTAGDGPRGLVYDGDGYLWVGCHGSTNILKLDLATGTVSVTYDVSPGRPQDMALVE